MADIAGVDFAILAGAGAPTRSYKAGDVIFREGEPAQELYIVKSGRVEVRLGNRVLDTLPELSIFGEMALVDHSPRSATSTVSATAIDPRAGYELLNRPLALRRSMQPGSAG